jgi:pimeloyl-ACP methyl ester carboxylesterase
MSAFRNTAVCVVLLSCFCAAVHAESLHKTEITIQVRGQTQTLTVYRAISPNSAVRKLLFAPGDAGCRGFAISIAEELAKVGYDTYCFDTLQYLRSVTGSHVLTTLEIAADFRTLADSINEHKSEPILLVGWSEGAGLGLVAAGCATNHEVFSGLVAIGTPEVNILAWRWRDVSAWITKSVPHEPTFKSADFVDVVSPLPLFFIASSSNEYVSPEATRSLFSKAREPKQLVIVDARDHKYGGNRDDFFNVLRQATGWIEQQQTTGHLRGTNARLGR